MTHLVRIVVIRTGILLEVILQQLQTGLVASPHAYAILYGL